MLNLLKFEFRRIFKSIFFRIIGGYCIIWPILISIFYKILVSISIKEEGFSFTDYDMPNDELRLFTWIITVAFVNELPKFMALFACLHIGRDFSDGIVRNKIIAGHSRTAIFFSYMITQLAALLAWCVVYISFALLGLLITGFGVNLNGGEMFTRYIVAVFTLMVMTVIFVVLSLSFRRRALPIIFSIVFVMLLSTAASVVGSFNMSSKAVDDYIEIRHDRYEEMIDEGILTDDEVEELEEEYDRDHYLGIPWKVCHPAYLFTNLGFNGDYSTDIVQLLVSNTDYKDEIDYSVSLVGNFIDNDMSGLTARDLKHVDSMHMPYSTLNLIYIVRSVFWILCIGALGYVVFRKRNLF